MTALLISGAIRKILSTFVQLALATEMTLVPRAKVAISIVPLWTQSTALMVLASTNAKVMKIVPTLSQQMQITDADVI
jgi:hypothetical protein